MRFERRRSRRFALFARNMLRCVEQSEVDAATNLTSVVLQPSVHFAMLNLPENTSRAGSKKLRHSPLETLFSPGDLDR